MKNVDAIFRVNTIEFNIANGFHLYRKRRIPNILFFSSFLVRFDFVALDFNWIIITHAHRNTDVNATLFQ